MVDPGEKWIGDQGVGDEELWPLARRRQHQSTGGEERQGRESGGAKVFEEWKEFI